MNQIQRKTANSIRQRTEIGPDLLKSGQIAESTRQLYQIYFEEYLVFAGSIRSATNPAFLAAWRDDLLERGYFNPNGEPLKYSHQAITARMAAVKKVMQMADERELLERGTYSEFQTVRGVSPKALKERKTGKKNKTAISAAQVREMIDGIEIKENCHMMHRALLLTMYTVACRVAELRLIKYADIQQHHTGHFTVMIAGKNKVEPTPRSIGKEAYEAIQKWREVQGEHEYIFTGSSGEPITTKWIRSLCHKYGEKIGLPNLTPHDARRFVLSRLVDVNPAIAQQQAGHANIQTTMGYDTQIRTLGATENLF